jgi:hypothetical protein
MSSTSDSHTTDQQALAKATLSRVRTGLDQGQMPAMSQIVQVIREISEKADQMSVQDLADMISRDESTMQRILSIANTLAYNPGGAEITTIPQAVTLVGFERIRNLAISVLLLENVDQNAGAEVNRELAGLSLTGGLFASAFGRRIPGMEPDLAFLCGALRSYGRMLMCNFLHDDYEKALEAASQGGLGSDTVFRQQFGLTPLELAHELLTGMHMPQMILKTLHEIPQEIRQQLSTTPAAELLISAELGLRIAESLASQPLGPHDFKTRLAEVTKDYTKEFHLGPSDAGRLVADVVSQIASFSQAGKFATGNVVLFKRMECLSQGVRPPAPFKPAPKTAPAAKDAAPPPQNVPTEPRVPTDAKMATTVLGHARQQLERLLAQPNPNFRECFDLLASSLQKALDLQSCLVFLREPGGSDYRMEQGLGSLTTIVNASTILRSGQRDVFAVPLSRGEDVMIQNPQDPRMKAFIPEWLRPAGTPMPFILLPLRDEQGTYGLVCGNTTSHHTLTVASQLHDELRLVRELMSRAGSRIRARQP